MKTQTAGQKAAATRKANAAKRATMTGLCVASATGYRAATREEILDAAAVYFVAETKGKVLQNPIDAVDTIRKLCAGRDFETLAVLFLNTRHGVIAAEPLFRGTIDGCAVYPREIAKRAMELNAAAVILGHNHPSGDPEPSEADRNITTRTSRALALLDVRLLDHIVVTNDSYVSLGARGWI